MNPRRTGMMPILHSPGLMMPGQLGPMRRVVLCSFSAAFTPTCAPHSWAMPQHACPASARAVSQQPEAATGHAGRSWHLLAAWSRTGRRTMSCWGMPSVMQTTRGISASTASRMAAAAKGGGTYTTEALAPVSCMASCAGLGCRPTRPAAQCGQGMVAGRHTRSGCARLLQRAAAGHACTPRAMGARLDVCKHGEADVRAARLLGVDAAHHLGAILDRLPSAARSAPAVECSLRRSPVRAHLLRVEGAVLPGQALADDLGVLVHKDGCLPQGGGAAKAPPCAAGRLLHSSLGCPFPNMARVRGGAG